MLQYGHRGGLVSLVCRHLAASGDLSGGAGGGLCCVSALGPHQLDLKSWNRTWSSKPSVSSDSSAAASSPPSPSPRSDPVLSKLMDSAPALYVAKFGRIVEADPKVLASPMNLTTATVSRVVGAVRESDSYEDLVRKLNPPPPKPTRSAEAADEGDLAVKKIGNGDVNVPDRVSGQPGAVLDSAENWAQVGGGGGLSGWKDWPQCYLMLAKWRLTLLVASTSAAGFFLATGPPPDGPTSTTLLLLSTAGVTLLSASANSLNQFLEVPFDSQMKRTRNRVLVRGALSPGHALAFAGAAGLAGTVILAHQVNLTAAALGLANLVLYVGFYTPLKRVSVANTWVGSLVGALPPLMGWASATGGHLGPDSLVLASLLFAWQFPHFNALSWNLRPDYSKAGYRMMSVTDPDLCRRVALRYSIACVGICSVAAPGLGVTEASFALESLPPNAVLVYLAWKFYKDADSASSRRLFKFTLLHLPIVMLLMFVCKKRPQKNRDLDHLRED